MLTYRLKQANKKANSGSSLVLGTVLLQRMSTIIVVVAVVIAANKQTNGKKR